MKKLLLVSALIMTSCVSWFVNDAGPAIQATMSQTETFLEVCDNFREIVNMSTGITAEQKTAIIKKITDAVELYRSLEVEQLEYLKSVDGEEHMTLLRESMELFLQYYNK